MSVRNAYITGILIVISLAGLYLVGQTILGNIVHKEIQTQKKEAITEIKDKIDEKGIDTLKIDKVTAKAIHSFKSFKEGVKLELHKLDSVDSIKNKQ